MIRTRLYAQCSGVGNCTAFVRLGRTLMSSWIRKSIALVASVVTAATMSLVAVVTPAHAATTSVTATLVSPTRTYTISTAGWAQYYGSGINDGALYADAGSTTVITYHFVDQAGAALTSTPVTLRVNKTYSGSNATFVGGTVAEFSLSATTNSSGDASFTLVNSNTDAQAQARPASTSTAASASGRIYTQVYPTLLGLADTAIGGDMLEINYIKSLSAATASPTPTATSTAGGLASCTGVTSNFIASESFSSLTVTGNGTKTGTDLNTDNTDLTFQFSEASKACQKIQVSLYQLSSGLNLSTTTGTGSTNCEAGPWGAAATTDHGCFITLDNTGSATFHVGVSGAAGKSFKYMLVGPGWSSATSGGTATVTFGSNAGGSSTASPTATATATATPTASASASATGTVPAAVKITLSTTSLAGPGSSVGNGWYHGNAPANNYVQYVVAGQSFTLAYLVKNAATDVAVGAGVPVTLAVAKSGAGVANFNGSLSALTNASGIATFSLTNTNTDASAETYRSDLTTWTDVPAGSAEYKADFTPTVTGATVAASAQDLVWTHTVRSVVATPTATPTASGSATPTSAPTPHVKITLAASTAAGTLYKDVNGVSTPIGNTWWHGNASSNNYVKYVEAGSTLTLSYNVTDANGVSVGTGTTVTLTPAKGGGDVNFTGSLTATTNSSGVATFTLVNTNTNSTSEYRRADMTVWSDVPAGTTEYKYDFTPSVTGSIADVADLVWTHTVSTQMATSTPSPTATGTATPTASNGCSGVADFITGESFSKLAFTGNGTKSGSVLNADNTDLTFQFVDSANACKAIQVNLYNPSTGLTLDTTPAANSSTACAAGPWTPVASTVHSCYIILDSTGTATFHVAVSGTVTGASFQYSLAGPGWDSSTGGGFATVTYAGGATPTATASATSSPTATQAVNVKLTSSDAASMFTIGNVWWRENANSNSYVKYVPAGSGLTLHYVVTDGTGSPISGAAVALETTAIAGGAFSGTLSGTTNASGEVTFTLTNTNTDPSTESARADYSVWSDSTSSPQTVEMDFLPTVSGATYVGRDRVWTHIVPSAAVIPSPSATATPTPTPTATTTWVVKQTTFSDANSTDRASDAAGWVANGWYHAGLGYRDAHVTVGTSKTITYHVTDGSAAASGRTVTFVFGKQYSNSTANVTVGAVSSTGNSKTVTGVTDSNGNVSFTLANTDSSVGATKLFTQVAAYVTDPAVDTIDITDVIYDAASTPTPTPTPTPTYSVPGAPSAVAIKAVSATSVVISWTAPASNGGTAVTDYSYIVKNNGVAVVGKSATVAGTSTTITGLVSTGKYSVSVTANNAVGSSTAASSVGTVSPSATAAKAPGAPTLVKTVWTAGTPTEATVYWTAPALNNNASLLNYSVVVKKAGVSVDTLSVLPNASVTVSSLSYPGLVVTGLELGKAYTFVVSAVNSVGSTAAAATAALTPAVAPGAPTLVSAVRGSLTATISWTAPASNGGSVITGYTVTCTAGAVTKTAVGTATATSAVVKTLLNGTTYTCSVTAKNAKGTSVASSTQTVTPATVPTAPTAAAGVAGNGQVTVSWTPSAINGGSPLTGFAITVKAGATVVKTVSASATDRSAVVTGLTNGTAYTFSVVAVNSVGNSVAKVSTAVVPSTTPGNPTIGTTTQTSTTSLTVKWTAPASTGGSAITGYEIKVYSNGVQVGAAKLAAKTATSLVVTGLTTKTAYTFTVAAKNINGTSAASAASTAVSTK